MRERALLFDDRVKPDHVLGREKLVVERSSSTICRRFTVVRDC